MINLGYSVDSALDASEALVKVKLNHYDLIITDIQMPKMNGYEFVEIFDMEQTSKKVVGKYANYSDKLDENQFRQEVGSILVKYSINEEQIRLRTHLKEYFRLLNSDESVGKRLDFLMQEMNRETNTTASKSQIADINIEAVKMKDAIENIREQIRNIE